MSEDNEKVDKRKAARTERHLWILGTIRTKQGLTRADLLKEIYMTWGVSVQVCRDDLNDLSGLGLIAIGVTGTSRKDQDRVMLTGDGTEYLRSRGRHKEAS